jgi:hypothetical protein
MQGEGTCIGKTKLKKYSAERIKFREPGKGSTRI